MTDVDLEALRADMQALESKRNAQLLIEHPDAEIKAEVARETLALAVKAYNALPELLALVDEQQKQIKKLKALFGAHGKQDPEYVEAAYSRDCARAFAGEISRDAIEWLLMFRIAQDSRRDVMERQRADRARLIDQVEKLSKAKEEAEKKLKEILEEQ